jgi:cobalt/nickel transport system permease protein
MVGITVAFDVPSSGGAMHFSPFHAYRVGDSLLHGIDPRVKLLTTLGFVLSVSLAPVGAWPIYVLLFAFVQSASVASELGWAFVLRRAALALPFVLAALPILVTVKGDPLLSIPLGAWSLSVTAAGLERFLSIALKSWLSVQMAILLTATTPLPDLLLAMRAFRLPRLLIAILSLMWRYLAVLIDEAMRMMRAREARSGSWQEHGGGSLLWRARVTGAMAGTLFLRGYERSERIYNAMLARGYDGTSRSFPPKPLSTADWLLLLSALFVLSALLLLGHLLG